jgi:Fe-S-cluster containining protein
MEANYRVKSFEQAMEEIEAVRRQAEMAAKEGNVPCNGCTLCCLGDAVRILPEDDPGKYQTEPHDHFPGQLMLAHKPDNSCVYLSSGGCSIHEDKPLMCREMDCRRLARQIKRKDLKRYGVPVGVWNKGRLLICR